uniref:Uncharacterized protein n=1 Tax=Oryzias sinensis TaxID=183150 RepID=A0A8C7X8G8_9TELE
MLGWGCGGLGTKCRNLLQESAMVNEQLSQTEAPGRHFKQTFIGVVKNLQTHFNSETKLKCQKSFKHLNP